MMDNPGNNKNSIWDIASKAGVALGAVAAAYMVLSQFMARGTDNAGAALLFAVLQFALWAGKFAFCIYLMKFFMLKYAAGNKEVTNHDTFLMGTASAFLSALIFAGANLAYITYIQPDAIEAAMQTMIESYGNMFTADMKDEIERLDIASISFFSNLIYCTLYGTVLSAILSRNIPSRNPFANDRLDDQRNQNEEQ